MLFVSTLGGKALATLIANTHGHFVMVSLDMLIQGLLGHKTLVA